MLTQVEKYDIIDEIGHGGMATVYRARDTRLDRAVALKVMHPHLQGAKEARARFAREALTVAKLRHPSILEIYDYSGEDSEVSYIATELLTGPTLKEFAETHAHIPAELAACIVIHVARALAAAHVEGVIHRDVKPENVMFHERSAVKLTDFGIAQLVDAQSMTTTGQVLGSPGHMAPEQVEGRECGARTDLFALGTVLYLLATSELPFRGSNPHQVLKQIVDGRFTDPLQVRPSIGGRMREIILRCLRVNPDERYQTASELEQALLEFVGELGIDNPSEVLAQYLADPEPFATDFLARTIEKLIELGEAAQRKGAIPRALDHFNRVLALDEGNERVLSALKRLGRRQRARTLFAVSVMGGAAVALVIFLIFQREQDASPVTSITPERKPVPVLVPRERESQPVSSDSTAGTAAESGPTKKPGVRPVAFRGPRVVSFKPFPANVSIGIDGGRPTPFGPNFRQVKLSPGRHRFKFVGAYECCVDEEVVKKIPPGRGTFTVSHRLAFRPAGLYVVSNTSAAVSVDGGKISGRANSVIKVSNLRSLRENHQIRVTAEGYKDHVALVRLQAGQVETLKVSLARVSP